MIYERSFASNPRSAQWHPTLNGDTVPRDVFKSCCKKFWFTCETCDHVFDMYLYSITNGGWCSYCSNRRLCEDPKCVQCNDKSFASHYRSSRWHVEKNKSSVPRSVFKHDNHKYWFTCDACDHEFDITLNSVTKGSWCPYCYNKKLCGDMNCARCFDKSFSSCPRSSQWHPVRNERDSPRSIFKHSNKKFWFICETCNHDFDIQLNSVTTAGSWCSFCSNPPSRLCDDLDCIHCYDKSFVSHPKSRYWHPEKNGSIVPRSFFKNSFKKFWFSCETCHNDFVIALCDASKGGWCGKCKHKTEIKLFTILKETWPSTVHQFKQDWCMKKNHLPFDFCIPGKKVIIELDGRHHFTQVSNWTTPEACLENDVFKQKCANENGYSVVRIIQKDVWLDKYDWRTKLQETIDGIHDGDCMNVFLCENGEYDSRRAALIYAC